MPREQARRLKPRSAVPSVEGKPKLTPQARPVDPYSVSGVSQGTQDLLVALDAVNKGAKALGQAGEMWAEEQGKKGARARAKGVERDDTRSNAFIAGYEKMDGEYKGIEFQAAVGKYVAENSHLPPDEFKAGLDDLQREHIGQLGHDGQLDSFMPAAMKADSFAQIEYQKVQSEKVLAERNAKVTSILDARAGDIMNDGLKRVDIDGFGSLLEDPSAREHLIENKDQFMQDIAGPMRALLDEKRAEYKELGLSTQEISKAMLGIIGRQAERYGLPELMGYAFLKDAAGISVADAYPEAVNKFLTSAVSNGQTIHQTLLKAQADAKKEAVRAKTNEFYYNAFSLQEGDVDGAMKALVSLSSHAAEMNPADVERLSQYLWDITKRKGYAKRSDPEVVTDLFLRWAKGTLTVGDLEEQRQQISAEDFGSLANKLHEDDTKAGPKEKLKRNNHMVTLVEQNLNNRLAPRDNVGRFLNPGSARVLAWSLHRFQGLLADKIAERRGLENLTNKDFFELEEEVIKAYTPYIKKLMPEGDSPEGPFEKPKSNPLARP